MVGRRGGAAVAMRGGGGGRRGRGVEGRNFAGIIYSSQSLFSKLVNYSAVYGGRAEWYRKILRRETGEGRRRDIYSSVALIPVTTGQDT